MSVVSIRDLSRNPSAVVDEVERSGRPAVVTRNGKPVAALVRIDQEALEDWLLATVGDPPVGKVVDATAEAPPPSERPLSDVRRQKDLSKVAPGLSFEVIGDL